MPLTTRPSPRHPVCPVCAKPFAGHAYRTHEAPVQGKREGDYWRYQCECGHAGTSKHRELRTRPLKAPTHHDKGRVHREHYTIAQALRDIRKLYGWNLRDLATLTRVPYTRMRKLAKGAPTTRAEKTLLKRFARRIDHRRLLDLLMV